MRKRTRQVEKQVSASLSKSREASLSKSREASLSKSQQNSRSKSQQVTFPSLFSPLGVFFSAPMCHTCRVFALLSQCTPPPPLTPPPNPTPTSRRARASRAQTRVMGAATATLRVRAVRVIYPGRLLCISLFGSMATLRVQMSLRAMRCFYWPNSLFCLVDPQTVAGP